MGSLNRWTHSDNVISFLERKEWTRHRSLNCWTRSSKFKASFNSKLPALEYDRLKLTPKMVADKPDFQKKNYEKSEHTIG
jgi:hypothetical protein